jgi:hypothetical protein
MAAGSIHPLRSRGLSRDSNALLLHVTAPLTGQPSRYLVSDLGCEATHNCEPTQRRENSVHAGKRGAMVDLRTQNRGVSTLVTWPTE